MEKEKSTSPQIEDTQKNLISGRGDHPRGGLAETLHGVGYQIRLCMVYFLQALDVPKEHQFGLTSEHTAVEKFDDVIYKVHDDKSDHVYHLVQAKHVLDPDKMKIKATDLLKTTGKKWKDRLTLQKYFTSYRQIVNMKGVSSSKRVFVICTNADLDIDDLKQFNITVKQEENNEFMKIFGGSCYQLKSQITDQLYTTLKETRDASDAVLLAKEIIQVKKDENASYSFLKLYWQPLLDDVFAKENGVAKIREGFISNNGLPDHVKQFRDIFKNVANMKDDEFQGYLKKIKIKLTKSFLDDIAKVESKPQLPSHMIHESDIAMFLQEFIIAVNQPIEKLNKIIRERIHERYPTLNTDLMTDRLRTMMTDWLDNRMGPWLTKEDGNSFELEMRQREDLEVSKSISLQYTGMLNRSDVCLTENNFIKTLNDFFGNSDFHILQVLSDTEYSYLTELKIYYAVQTVTKSDSFKIRDFVLIFVDSERLLKYECIQNAFKSECSFNLLIVSYVSNNILNTNLLQLCKSTINTPNTKIIAIVEGEIDLNKQQLLFQDLKMKVVIDDGLSFNQLSEGSQTQLLQKKIVNLQENDERLSLVALFGVEDDEEIPSHIASTIKEIIDPETLTILIKGNRDIKIGIAARETSVISDIYIERHLKIEESYSIDEDAVLEKDFGKQLMVINDETGAGKSTLLNSICKKARSRNILICRIDLNDYTKAFNKVKFLEKIDDPADFLSKSLLELFEDTKLKTNFEYRLFKLALDGQLRLFLFFDGFDEICPNYENVMVRLLWSLQRTRVEKIFVTTRIEVCSILKERLSAEYYNIKPLSEDEQKLFLSKYWAKQLGKDPLETEEWFTEFTLRDVGNQTGDRTNLANPLTLVMVAEYWKDYIFDTQNTREKETIISSIDFDVLYLHKHFINKKFKIYQIEKSKTNEDNVSSGNVFKNFTDILKGFFNQLALTELFGEEIVKNLFKKDMNFNSEIKTEIVKIGIVRQVGSGYRFFHRTFAEHFVTEFILNDYETAKPLLKMNVFNGFVKSLGHKRASSICQYLVDFRVDSIMKGGFCDSEDKDEVRFINEAEEIHRHLALRSWCGQQISEGLLYEQFYIDPAMKVNILKAGLVEEVEGELKFVGKWIFRHFLQPTLNKYVISRITIDEAGNIAKFLFDEYFKLVNKDGEWEANHASSLDKDDFTNRLETFHLYVALLKQFGEQTTAELLGEDISLNEALKEELENIGLLMDPFDSGGLYFVENQFHHYFIREYFKRNRECFKNISDDEDKDFIMRRYIRYYNLL